MILYQDTASFLGVCLASKNKSVKSVLLIIWLKRLLQLIQKMTEEKTLQCQK